MNWTQNSQKSTETQWDKKKNLKEKKLKKKHPKKEIQYLRSRTIMIQLPKQSLEFGLDHILLAIYIIKTSFSERRYLKNIIILPFNYRSTILGSVINVRNECMYRTLHNNNYSSVTVRLYLTTSKSNIHQSQL